MPHEPEDTTIRRGMTTADKLHLGVNAYPPDPDEHGWSFQLAFVVPPGTAVTFSGLERHELEAYRDQIDAVLAAAGPRTDQTIGDPDARR